MPTDGPLLILAGRLADGASTSSRKDQAVLVADGLIKAAGDRQLVRQQAPPDTEVLDLGPWCLAPGFIDNHTHLSLPADSTSYPQMFAQTDEMMVLIGAMNLERHLAAGITTVRDNGARNGVGFTLKEALAHGYIRGPRLLVSGRSITCTRGHFHMCNEIADGEEEMRRSVRRLVHEGADFIKIMASGGGTAGTIPGRASYSVAELHAAVHEARHFQRLTAAHCRAREAMVRAVEAGIDLLEHAEFLEPDGELRFDPKLAEMMAEAGVWISPTLQAWTGYPRIVALRDQRQAGRLTPAGDEELSRLEARAEMRLDLVRRLLDHGLLERLVPGTDSGVGNLVFGHLDYDLQLFVQVGFTPAQALAAATRVSAEAIGLADRVGTIAPGKAADLVAMEGDPTVDVGACSRVRAVFQAGRRIR